jgi:hypothetical protein
VALAFRVESNYYLTAYTLPELGLNRNKELPRAQEQLTPLTHTASRQI